MRSVGSNMVLVPTLHPRVQQLVGNLYAVWRANLAARASVSGDQ